MEPVFGPGREKGRKKVFGELKRPGDSGPDLNPDLDLNLNSKGRERRRG